MPHQCVRCNTFYDDGSEEILKGCPCGGRLFFYVRKEKLEQSKKILEDIKLSEEDKQQVEKDVFELVGTNPEKEDPVILDLESIRVVKPGKYEIDLVHLFKGDPIIFKLQEGKYMIDLVETFKRAREKNI